MATARRKLSLGDVRGPESSPRLQGVGGVRQRIVPIRPMRFRPKTELINFRALSQTISRTLDAAGRMAEAMEEDRVGGEIENFIFGGEEVAAWMQGEDGALPPVVDLLGAGEAEGNVLITGDPVIDIPRPTGIPAQQLESGEIIADATRRGLFPATANPMLKNVEGAVAGELRGNTVLSLLQGEDFDRLTTYDLDSRGPQADYWATVQARSREAVEALGDDKDARRAMAMLVYKGALRLEGIVNTKLNDNRKVVVPRQRYIPLIQTDLRRALDPSTITDFSQDSLTRRSLAVARSVNLKVDELIIKGDPVNPVDLLVDASVGLLRALPIELEDNTPEAQGIVDQLDELLGNLMYGKVRAEDHELYQTKVAPLIDQIQRRFQDPQKDKWSKFILEANPDEYSAVRKALEDRDGQDRADRLNSARRAFKAVSESAAALRNLTPAQRNEWNGKTQDILNDLARTHGFQNINAGISSFRLDEIVEMAANGNSDGANTLLQESHAMLGGDDYLAAVARIDRFTETLPQALNGTSAGASLTQLAKDFAKAEALGVPGFQETKRDYLRFRPKFIEMTNNLFQQGEVDGNGRDTVNTSMGSGELAQAHGLLRAPIDLVLQTHDDAMNEMAELTRTRKRSGPEDAERFIPLVGPRAFADWERANHVATNADNVIFSGDLKFEWGRVEAEVELAVADLIQAEKGDAETALDPRLVDRKIANTVKRITPELREMAASSGRELFGGGSQTWKGDLSARIQEVKADMIAKLPSILEKMKMDSRIRVHQRMVEDAFRNIATKTRSEYGTGIKSLPGQMGNPAKNALGTSFNTFADWVSERRFGISESSEVAARKLWLTDRGGAVLATSKNTDLSVEGRNQAIYELLALDGRIGFRHFREGVVSVEVQVPQRVFFPSIVPGGPTKLVTKSFTVDLTKVKANPYLGPLWNSVQDMENDLRSPDFHEVAEKLGFTGLDKTKSPVDEADDKTFDVRRLRALQANLIQFISQER